MLFGAFLMKNIFIIFPTHILNYIFCIISSKIQCFSLIWSDVVVHNCQLCLKKHENFTEIMQKIQFKIGVGKMMKIFFIRNAPNSIVWPLKVFPYYACGEITLMHVKKSSFFMFVDYYRDSNSKCMHYIIALQKRVSFVRARSRK